MGINPLIAQAIFRHWERFCITPSVWKHMLVKANLRLEKEPIIFWNNQVSDYINCIISLMTNMTYV